MTTALMDARDTADVEAIWQRESVKYPGTSKDTFVGNCLFGIVPHALLMWMCEQPELAIVESETLSPRHMIEERHGADNRVWVRMDLKREHVITRVAIEVVRDGRSKLSRDQSWRWHDDD